MKKIILSGALIIFTASLFAQTDNSAKTQSTTNQAVVKEKKAERSQERNQIMAEDAAFKKDNAERQRLEAVVYKQQRELSEAKKAKNTAKETELQASLKENTNVLVQVKERLKTERANIAKGETEMNKNGKVMKDAEGHQTSPPVKNPDIKENK